MKPEEKCLKDGTCCDYHFSIKQGALCMFPEEPLVISRMKKCPLDKLVENDGTMSQLRK